MRNKMASMITIVLASSVIAYPSFASAEEKAEGKVVSTKLTACDMEKGGCEGYLTLEPKDGGKAASMNIRVVRGTPITKGTGHVYLPALRGNFVAVSYVTDKGEKLAKSIDVLPTKR